LDPLQFIIQFKVFLLKVQKRRLESAAKISESVDLGSNFVNLRVYESLSLARPQKGTHSPNV
jgi:hypothetical protein